MGNLNVSHPRNFLPLEQIVLGPECEDLLIKLSNNHVKEVRRTCLRFYVRASTEMQDRLPLKPSFIDDLRFLAPSIALNVEDRESVKDLSHIAKRFEGFDST